MSLSLATRSETTDADSGGRSRNCYVLAFLAKNLRLLQIPGPGKSRAEIEVYKGIKLFGALNNIFDVNASPIFIATDTSPCLANNAAQNGSCGNSMAGRNFFVGAQWKF